MKASRTVRWSGRASVAVGGLWMLWTLAPWAGQVLILALICALLALLGLPLRHESQTRILAWVGYLVSAVSIVLSIIGYGSVFLTSSSSPLLFLIGLGDLCFGLLLLGFASLQAQVLPRGNIFPIALGVLLGLQIVWGWIYLWNNPNPPFSVIAVWLVLGICFGSVWIALGQILTATTRTPTRPLYDQ